MQDPVAKRSVEKSVMSMNRHVEWPHIPSGVNPADLSS